MRIGKLRIPEPLVDDERNMILILRIARKAGAPTADYYLEKLKQPLSELQMEKVFEEPIVWQELFYHEEKWENKIPKDKKSWR